MYSPLGDTFLGIVSWTSDDKTPLYKPETEIIILQPPEQHVNIDDNF